MKRIDLARELVARFSSDEWQGLADDAPHCPEHGFNRDALVQLREWLDAAESGNVAAGMAVPDEHLVADDVRWLDGDLTRYMATYLTEDVPRQKYIVASCLALAFVLRQPMHPVDRVGAQRVHTPEGDVFLCPAKVVDQKNICDFCVCRKLA